jgi:hypothetical protein
MKRFGKAEEVAETALHLANDASSFTTGTVMVVDGGWLAGRRGWRSACSVAEIQLVQPYRWLTFRGFLRHFSDLDDARRPRPLRALRQFPPA